jgi:hypothetical protein
MRYRPAEPSDALNAAEWIQSTPSNNLDPAVAAYPLLYTFAVEDEHGPLLYVPTHPVLMIESVAVRPGTTPRQYIEGLLEAKSATAHQAQQLHIREIYTSSGYEPMAKTLRRHGYTPVTGALRKRVL